MEINIGNASGSQQGTKVTLYYSPESHFVYSFHTPGNNGQPMNAYHNLDLYLVGLPKGFVEEDVENVLQNLETRLQLIREGFEKEWDGSNHVGTLNEEAEEILFYIQRELDELELRFHADASEWLGPCKEEVMDQFLSSSLPVDEFAEFLCQESLGDAVLDAQEVEDWLVENLEELEKEKEDEDARILYHEQYNRF